MTFRPAPLRAAAILAAVFIAARVVYRILFDGADAGGPVVVPLPAFRLPEPFAHVQVLGPITTGGLWDAVASAVPIAALILAFGVLNALVDVSRGFAVLARRGPLRGVARVLAVAWATLPALADAVRTVRFAFRLRGERFGVRALVPVLERTLERASSVAAALELRGLGARAGWASAADCTRPVDVHDAVFSPQGVEAGVSGADFAPETGSLTVVTGATGAGKSTLLRGLAGLLSHVDGGSIAGTVRVAGLDRAAVPPRDTSRFVGVVLQNPREAFATERVRDEIGLALELRGVASVIVAARVAEVAAHVGVTALLDRPVRALSAGEATLVAIAAAVIDRPVVMLVDEPLADLDVDARSRVADVLDALAHEAGVCVIVAEHRAAAFVPTADAWWTIADGALVPGDAPTALPGHATLARTGTSELRSEPVLVARGVSVRRDRTSVVSDASLALHAGEIVALVGPNGAGKSSLLGALALPERGAHVAAAGRVALVPDTADDLFTRDTVGAELRAADRRAARARDSARAPHPRSRIHPLIHPAHQTVSPQAGGAHPLIHPVHQTVSLEVEGAAARFARFLGRDGAAAEARRHPRDLSVGERRCLAIALQTADDPLVVMIDEPTRGLDAEARDLVAGALRAAAGVGAAVLIATHDADFAAALGARVVPMRDGVAPAAHLAPTADVLAAQRSRTGSARSAHAADAGVSAPSSDDRTVSVHAPEERRARRRTRALTIVAVTAANLVALAAFCWPLIAAALPAQAASATPFAALALAPLAAVAVAVSLDGTVRSAHTIALLGVLAAIGTAVRIASSGVGGVEAVFILLILAGRAFGARFGLLLGVATIAVSSVLWGGIGPWTPFQMFACAWVGAGAGLLPRRVRGWAEVGMLCAYGIVASYLFGLLMNLWFWPFAVGAGTGISYAPGAPLGQNLASFLVYSLVTSTLSWDTLRAITTVIGVVVVGRAVLAALRRAKPVSSAVRAPAERIEVFSNTH
jgi:energy-coupling factor transport system ATP-binding protein